MSEWILRDLSAVGGPSDVAFRYFNVAGCDHESRIGQSTAEATLLINVACEVDVGKRDSLAIFGSHHPTPDDSGVRDYIHIEALATSHLCALDYL